MLEGMQRLDDGHAFEPGLGEADFHGGVDQIP
jgi:hypothetical protein